MTTTKSRSAPNSSSAIFTFAITSLATSTITYLIGWFISLNYAWPVDRIVDGWNYGPDGRCLILLSFGIKILIDYWIFHDIMVKRYNDYRCSPEAPDVNWRPIQPVELGNPPEGGGENEPTANYCKKCGEITGSSANGFYTCLNVKCDGLFRAHKPATPSNS